MKDDERQGEDVAGLFRRFGGDAKGYKEFAPAEIGPHPSGTWPLVGGLRPGPAPGGTAAVAGQAPPVPPAPAPADAGGSAAPRELDVLFARLAGAERPAAPVGQGLMSRWRRPA
jgi:hypothetical protein